MPFHELGLFVPKQNTFCQTEGLMNCKYSVAVFIYLFIFDNINLVSEVCASSLLLCWLSVFIAHMKGRARIT